MQRAVEAEFLAREWVIRDAPVPLRVQRLLGRRRRALDAQQRLLQARAAPPPLPRWRLVPRPEWVPLVLAPLLLLVVYQYGDLVFPLAPVSRSVRRSAIVPVGVLPVAIPAPSLPPTSPDMIPPEVPALPPLPPETDLSRGPAWERKIALTFDGGSEANATAEILDTLKSMGVKATIFLTGRYIDRYPDLVRRMVREGHEIGNHTFSHPHLTSFAVSRRQDTLPGVTRERVQGELRQTARLFEEVTGVPMSPYWRAPYGEHNLEIRRWAGAIGYMHVGWTRDLAAGEDLDTRDWVADTHSPIYYRAAEVRKRILNFGKGRTARANGGIILLHLGTQRKQDQVHRELRTIIDGLRAQGYDLVPVSELHRALALGKDGKGSAVAAER